MAQRPDPVQARIAPYTGRTSLFLFGGITLILANFLLSQQGWALVTAFLPSASGSQPPGGQASSVSLLDLGGQALMLGALLVIGSVSDEAGNFALIFLAALWLGFLFSKRALFTGLLGQASSPSSPSSSVLPPGGAPSNGNSTNSIG